MRVLVLGEYAGVPGGLATQGDLLLRGLRHLLGADAQTVHLESSMEKEWYYRWFKPDVVVGIGYWGHVPHLVLHPQRHGVAAVPWLVADGYIANYREILNDLPLILVTSEWVREVYIRDGIRPDIIEVLPVGCDTDVFVPRDLSEPKVAVVREALGIAPDDIMILTVGGDAASKGAQEVMRALALINGEHPRWKYVCKVWPQPRTELQNVQDLELAASLGISNNVVFVMDKVSRDFMPYLLAACDIYAGPSRLEGFGMTQVEAGACGKPVVAIKAMGLLDTVVHRETGFLARVAVENHTSEAVLSEDDGYEPGHRVVFDPPRIADYRASVTDIADHLLRLVASPALRRRMGAAARKRVIERFDYRVVARRFVDIVSRQLCGMRAASQPGQYSLVK